MNTGRTTTKEGKNQGVELIRAISMFLIVLLHVTGIGGVAAATPSGSLSHTVSVFLLAFSYVCVNVYALISGYVSCFSRFKPSRVLSLWLIVVFYNLLCIGLVKAGAAVAANVDLTALPPLLSKIVSGLSAANSSADIAVALQPMRYGSYWYFTAFVGLSALMPLLNAGVKNLAKRAYAVMLIAGFTLFSLLPFAWQTDPFTTANGYTLLWLALLYVTGAFFRLHPLEKPSKYVFLLAYVVLSCLTAALTLWWSASPDEGLQTCALFILQYTSPLVLAASVACFLFFVRVRIDDRVTVKIVSFFARSTFPVYIFHTNVLLFPFLLTGSFASFGSLSAPLLLLAVLASAAAIFLVCTFSDKVRIGLFRLLHINAALEALDRLFARFFEDKKEGADA